MASCIPSILLWEEPALSLAAFLPPLAALAALTCSSLVSVLAWAALLLLAGVAGIKLYVYVMVHLLAKLPPDWDPLAPVYRLELTVPGDRVAALSHTATDLLNSTLGELRRLFLAESLVDTAKFGASLYCLTYIGSWFNLLSLVILAWCALFSLPRLYRDNQAAVDEVVTSVTSKVDELKGMVSSSLPAGAGGRKED